MTICVSGTKKHGVKHLDDVASGSVIPTVVPIKHQTGDEVETNALAFCIESEITNEERYRDRTQTKKAIDYQQSLAMLREQSASSVPSSL